MSLGAGLRLQAVVMQGPEQGADDQIPRPAANPGEELSSASAAVAPAFSSVHSVPMPALPSHPL